MAVKESSLVSKMFSETTVVAGVVIGILLVWISSLMAQFSLGVDMTRAMGIFKNTGVTLVSIMLVGGGIVSTKDEKNIRVAMTVMGAVILLVQVLGWT
jgi:uncharacterized membrane protein (UPF0136 family)